MLLRLSRLLIATALFGTTATAAIVLNFFPVSAFNANTTNMDAALGVTGYNIETFEATNLIAGLSIVVSGGVPTTTFTSLPNLFDQAVCGSLSDNSTWDGTHGVINTTTNSVSNCNTPANISTQMTVNYAPGTRSLGVGFGNFQSLSSTVVPITNHELFVNGNDMGLLETLAGASFTPGFTRNGYLRVDGTAGTVITSVAIQNLTALDVLVFDHVAVAGTSTPEPATFGLVLGSALFLGARWWKNQRSRQ